MPPPSFPRAPVVSSALHRAPSSPGCLPSPCLTRGTDCPEVLHQDPSWKSLPVTFPHRTMSALALSQGKPPASLRTMPLRAPCCLSLGISHPSSTGMCSLLTAHQATVSPKASAVTHWVLPLTPCTALPSGSLFLGLTLYDFPPSSLFPLNQALAHRLYNRTTLPSLLPSRVSTICISPPSGPLLQLCPSPSTFHSPLTLPGSLFCPVLGHIPLTTPMCTFSDLLSLRPILPRPLCCLPDPGTKTRAPLPSHHHPAPCSLPADDFIFSDDTYGLRGLPSFPRSL